MDDLLHYLVEKIVASKDEINISRNDTGDSINFTIKLNDSDYGRLIGKGGKTINAIRHLLYLHTLKHAPDNRRIFVNIDSKEL